MRILIRFRRHIRQIRNLPRDPSCDISHRIFVKLFKFAINNFPRFAIFFKFATFQGLLLYISSTVLLMSRNACNEENGEKSRENWRFKLDAKSGSFKFDN